MRIHLVFHISLLELALANATLNLEEQPEIDEDFEILEYKVKKILDAR